MQKSVIYLFATLCIGFLSTGCHKEAALTPSEVYYPVYTVPQGTNDYDSLVKEVFDSTGLYILYKYDNQKDFRWLPPGQPGLLPLNIYASLPNTNMAATGVDTLKYAIQTIYQNLRLYGNFSNGFIKETSPYKVLVSGGFRGLTINNSKPTGYDTAATPSPMYLGGALPTPTPTGMVQMGFNHITFAIARNAATDTARFYPSYITGGANQNLFRSTFHIAYWMFIYDHHLDLIPPQFFSLADYTSAQSIANDPITSTRTTAQYGVLVTNPKLASPRTDYAYFIQAIITKSKADFDSFYSVANDPNGLLKQRRDVLCSYYKDKYGFDLQNLVNQ